MKLRTLIVVMLMLLLPGFVFAQDPASVIQYAGKGTRGYSDGVKENAQFMFPTYATVDANGNIYVSDSKNHLIRQISNGQVSTVAGKLSEKDSYGEYKGGYADGQANDAMFNEPQGIAVTEKGVIYVADSKNGAIRKIENQTVSTLVKDLKLPTGLVLGKNGELYVAETLNHRILKITEDGQMTVVAGGGYQEKDGVLIGGYREGTGTEAQFNEPTGLAIGANGTIYVADSANQRIRSISPAGEVKTVAGSGSDYIEGTTYIAGGYQDGARAQAKFNFPHGLTVTSDGTIYVADTLNHKIRKISKSGQVSTVAGIDEHGFINDIESRSAFDRPYDVLGLSNGDLIIVDYWNHSLRKLEWYQMPQEVYSQSNVHVVWNGQIISFDVEPMIVEGRTMLPIRQLAENFGYKVEWNEENQTITFTDKNRQIQMVIGSNEVTGDVQLTMDVAPFITNDRTFVPIRFVSEAFDKDVKWIEETKTVLIR